MASYRRRLERDLDGWIGRGLVPAGNRQAILDSAGEARRLDAATALGVIGAFLAGVAVIAFVAANWSAIPRLVRFAMILAAFLGASFGGAWASERGRPIASQALLSVAALIFAAAIGLTGQIFDITGDPQTALRSAAFAAVLLAAAGRAPWAAAVGLALFTLADLMGGDLFSGRRAPGWLAFIVAPAAALALAWRSQALAHATGLAAIVAVLTFGRGFDSSIEIENLVGAGLLAVGAVGARAVRERFEGPAGVLYGWFAAGALMWFGIAGFYDSLRGVVHSVAWLALSGAAVGIGRHDRHGGVSAVGVIALFAAGATLLFNLGVGLLTSAAVFGGLSIVALVVAFVLRRRPA